MRGKRQREGEVRREEGKRKVEERREKEKGGWGRQPPPQPRWRRERQERKQRERKGEEEGKGKEKEREKRRGKGDRKRGRREGIRASRRRGDRAHGGGGTGVAARGKPLFLCFSVLCLSLSSFSSLFYLLCCGCFFFLQVNGHGFSSGRTLVIGFKLVAVWLRSHTDGKLQLSVFLCIYSILTLFVHFYAAVSLN